MSVPLETAIRILKERGCTDPYICPQCERNGQTSALTISQNGAEPTFTCAAGCNVAAWLRTVTTLANPRGPQIDLLEQIRGDLNLPELEKIVKHGRGGSAYSMHLNDGRVVTVNGVTILANQARFRQAFLPQVRRNPKRHKAADWDNVVERIEQAAEERDAVATQGDETLSWIAGALHTGRLQRNVNIDNSAEMFNMLAPGRDGRPPFIDQHNRVYLRLEHMIEWLGRLAGIRVTQPELSSRLSELDFERKQLQARKGDQVHKGRYWVSPPGLEDKL